MRIWISGRQGLTVNFQPETEEESVMLDKSLGFNGCVIPIGNNPVDERAEKVGELGGHESQRWIYIDLNKFLVKSTRF